MFQPEPMVFSLKNKDKKEIRKLKCPGFEQKVEICLRLNLLILLFLLLLFVMNKIKGKSCC